MSEHINVSRFPPPPPPPTPFLGLARLSRLATVRKKSVFCAPLFKNPGPRFIKVLINSKLYTLCIELAINRNPLWNGALEPPLPEIKYVYETKYIWS